MGISKQGHSHKGTCRTFPRRNCKRNPQLQICDKERAALEVWGDFDPASVMRLQEVGYQVNFYICSEKNFNEEWLDTYYATEVNRIGSRIYFITITKEGTLPELEVAGR